jgi:hypothetical protein
MGHASVRISDWCSRVMQGMISDAAAEAARQCRGGQFLACGHFSMPLRFSTCQAYRYVHLIEALRPHPLTGRMDGQPF